MNATEAEVDTTVEIARLILSVSSVSYDEANTERRKMARDAAEKVIARLAPPQEEGDERFQDGITYALKALAHELNAEGWAIQDGSESVEGDVAGTIIDILRKGGVYDEDNQRIAALSTLQVKTSEAVPLTLSWWNAKDLMVSITETGEVVVNDREAFQALFDALPEVPHGGLKSFNVYPDPPASQADLREALTKVRNAITAPVNSLAIVDTVWMPLERDPGASIETLVDFIDATLSRSP